jgi:hypothetical protein
MSGLRAAANRPGHPLQPADLEQALLDAESLEIAIDATPLADVHRAWALAQHHCGMPTLYTSPAPNDSACRC